MRLSTKTTDSMIRADGISYSPKAGIKFRKMIDSLNSRFPTYTPDAKYNCKEQAMGHYVYFGKYDDSEARHDMDMGVSFEQFVKWYPKAEVERSQIIGREMRDDSILVFSSINLGSESHGTEIEAKTEFRYGRLKGKWVYDKSGSRAFYITSDFTSKELPKKYQDMIAYTDFMTGTKTRVFTSRAVFKNRADYIDNSPAVHSFLNYVNLNTRRPNFSKGDEFSLWFKKRHAIIDAQLKDNPIFIDELAQASRDAIRIGYTNEEMEDYAERYGSKEDALLLKRGRHIAASCGNDDGPRYHLYNILRLSVETLNRRLFVRSYLELFWRPFDNSRLFTSNPYIDELTKLHFDEFSIVFGAFFSSNNQMIKTRYSNADWMCLFMAEQLIKSKNADSWIHKIMVMIKDKDLDDYNRLLLCRILQDYIGFTGNHTLAKEMLATLPKQYSRQYQPIKFYGR